MAVDHSATSSTINLAMRSSGTGRVEGRSRGVAGGALPIALPLTSRDRIRGVSDRI